MRQMLHRLDSFSRRKVIKLSKNKTEPDEEISNLHTNTALLPGMLIAGKYKIIKQLSPNYQPDLYLTLIEKTQRKATIGVIHKNEAYASFSLQNLSSKTSIFLEGEHPNLLRMFDIIELEDKILLVFDSINETFLTNIIKKNGIQREDTIIDFGIQLCNVLTKMRIGIYVVQYTLSVKYYILLQQVQTLP